MNSLIDGKYRLLRTLGSGCVGSVFEVEHEHLGSRFALKLLHEDLQEEDGARLRFLARAKAAARIRHANVVRVEDVGVANGRPYMVSELCRGRPLQAILRMGCMNVDLACELSLHLLAALAAAHEHRIWHSDLKPQNVMIEFAEDGRAHVKVLDFGMTQGLFEDDARYDSARWARSSPRYLAPEVLTRSMSDARSDMYSVSALIYEMLAGKPLIGDRDEVAVIKRAVASQWEPLARANPALPEPLVRAIEATLDADPHARLASPQDLARQLVPYVSPRLRSRTEVRLPSLDPVLRFSRRVVDHEEPTSPSLRLNRAPKPRDDSAVPQHLLMEPTFPRNAPAPRLDSLNADAYGKRRKGRKIKFELEPHPMAETLLKGAGKTAAVAVGSGFGLGAALAWLNGVI